MNLNYISKSSLWMLNEDRMKSVQMNDGTLFVSILCVSWWMLS